MQLKSKHDTMATSGCVVDSDAYYRCYKALHLVTHEAIPCVDQCLQVWQGNQALPPCTTGQCSSGKKPKQPTSCQSCEDWGKILQAAAYKSQITWSNVSSTNLSKSHVEVAKAFVLRLQRQKTYTKIVDLDSASLLMIMTRFQPFHGGDQTSFEVIQKVAEIRNDLSHMRVADSMQIGDSKVKEYFGNLNAMVDCLVTLHPTHFTAPQDVKDELTKIQQEPVTAAMREEIQIQLSREIEQIRKDVHGISITTEQTREDLQAISLTTEQTREDLQTISLTTEQTRKDVQAMKSGMSQPTVAPKISFDLIWQSVRRN
ncbi:uncharacterized protein [Amphiura filiformis]|uniref:uncharacterized protein n=1 Tax=Amphiura filiformis TaxID=82378 RepID=UPI003B212C04